MKKCILHVGLHKTATSSIQETLAKNIDILQSNGIDFPIFDMNGINVINHSIPIYSLFHEEPNEYHINKRFSIDVEFQNNIYLKKLNECLDGDNDLILSGEDISILSKDALVKLKKILENKGFELSVYCVIRSPYSLLCSLVQQNIKGGVASLNNLSVVSISNIISKLDDVFENVKYFSFEKLCSSNAGLIPQFLKEIGVDFNDIKPISVNEGVGNKTSRLLNYINSKLPLFDESGKLNPRREGVHHFDSHVNCDKDKFLLTEDEFNIVKSDLEAENEFLAKRLGNDFFDESVRFSSKYISIDSEFVKNVVSKFSSQPKAIKRYAFEYIYSYSTLNELDEFFEQDELLNNFEMLRNTAMAWEKLGNYKNALYFMLKAKNLRPNGELVNKKIEQYNKVLFS
ncbi:hypothetical protein [Vibrio sp. H11]|uniref:hypothetical protein n=1 Tax=Vibrio sp. H11 TaxID=2565928 RepID=UPI0010A5C4AE|nr:hypothetical protein [Vibrio sp. H11]